MMRCRSCAAILLWLMGAPVWAEEFGPQSAVAPKPSFETEDGPSRLVRLTDFLSTPTVRRGARSITAGTMPVDQDVTPGADGSHAEASSLRRERDTSASPGASDPGQELLIRSREANAHGHTAASIFATRVAGAGSGGGARQALYVEQNATGARDQEQLRAITSVAHVTAGSGSAVALNPIAWASVGVATDAQIYGEEINTEADQDVNAKVGLQVIDEAASKGIGRILDAGLIVGSQVGASGYRVGLQFGIDPSRAHPGTLDGVRADGQFIFAYPRTIRYRSFIDISGLTGGFSEDAIILPAKSRIRIGTSEPVACAAGSVNPATLTTNSSGMVTHC